VPQILRDAAMGPASVSAFRAPPSCQAVAMQNERWSVGPAAARARTYSHFHGREPALRADG